jgi:hypothetical protein
MSSRSGELDIEPIRERLNRAGAFSLPRWVANDMAALLAEVDRLRAGAPPAIYDTEMKKKDSRIWVLERDLVAAKEEVSTARLIAERERSAAAAMEYEAEAERLSVCEWLTTFANTTPPGPVSPVRRSAQAFASRAAALIERGGHRNGETP